MKLTRWHRLYNNKGDFDAAPREDLAYADLVGFIRDSGEVQVWKDRLGTERVATMKEWAALVDLVREFRGPDEGTWPCQTMTHMASVSAKGGPPYRQMTTDGEVVSERLVAFLYRALRDGLPSPGQIEQVAIEIGAHIEPGTPYTNGHLERYARALAAYLCAKT